LEAFTYTVAHDLRAPLRAMQGFSQALLEDFGPQLTSDGRDYAHRIIAAAQRMDLLIQDLLSYSRLSRSQLTPETVDLDTVLGKVILTFAADIENCNAEIRVERPLPLVRAHAGTLEHVFINLISNAFKFVAPGTKPRVRLWSELRQGFARIWIQDNGIGISPEYHDRIFRVFERLHGGETFPGTGIGLAIVRKGVERMGGSVGLDSEAGQGSRFWIELPRLDAAKQDPKPR
jgi:signal transduction histidine kinase